MDADRRSEIYNKQKMCSGVGTSSASGTFAPAFLTGRQTPALGKGQRQAYPGEGGWVRVRRSVTNVHPVQT